MVKLIEDNYETLKELCKQYRVKRFEVFGSALTGDGFDPKKSDLDFLVEFLALGPGEHAECYFGLLEALQDLFQRDVDLVEIKAVRNPYLLESINENRRQIYAA